MSRYSLRPSAFVLALLSAIPAMGQAANSPVVSTFTSSLSNVRIELIDLAPNDGIAPSITFSGGGTLSGPSIPLYDSDGQEIPNPPIYSNSLLPSSTITKAFDNGNTVVTASPTGIEVKSQVTYDDLMSNSYGWSTPSPYLNSYSARGASVGLQSLDDPGINGTYTLSPNTVAVVRGTISNAWTLDGRAISSQLDPKYTSWSIDQSGGTNSFLQILHQSEFVDAQGNSQGGASSGGGANEDMSISAHASQTNDALQSNQSTNDFEFGLVNPNGQDQIGDVYVSVDVHPYLYLTAYGEIVPIDPGPITPGIPEPTTYALMGLGLVGITLVRRQRR
jgi:hypothetical protein